MLRGHRLPTLVTPPPGPASRQLARTLAATEAPGVNTVVAGKAAIAWRRARGANVEDVDGNVYIDLTAGFGVAAVGHSHPRVVAALRRQSGRLLHALGDVHPHPWRGDVAAALVARAPLADARVYFATSGSEAVEIALKTACLATGRPGVLAFDPAYHGLTLGALAATSRREFREPFAAQLNPRLHRLPYGCPVGEVAAALADGGVGAVIVEPLAGREGILLPPPGWLAELAAACRRHGALLVADEIFTGFGRTGHWFAVEAEGVEPDLLCCGKALAGGLPLAAVLGRSELMAAWDRGGEALHTSTFLANPVCCATALATLEVMAAEDLPRRARRLGEIVERHTRDWPSGCPCVVAVRGRGLMWGLQLTSPGAARSAVRGALERGVLVLAGGPAGDVVQLTPPLTITAPQLTTALALLREALAAGSTAPEP